MKQPGISKLAVIDEPRADATILTFMGTPLANGKGDMDLICGRCSAVLVHGQTATEVALQYKVLQLIIKCECGVYNSLSSPADAKDSITASQQPPVQPFHNRADRDRLVAEAAYYRAEKRGFAPGFSLEDWLCAEAQVDFELARSAR